jgi:N-acetylmuramoyl-L-alanine amidase
MTRLLLAVALLGAAGAEPTRVPTAIVVATARGEMTVPVSTERGHPVLPVRSLARLLPLSVEDSQQWLLVSFADQPFRFLLDAPLFVHEGRVVPLVGGAYERNDTVYVPLQWLTDYVPRIFREAYRYDPYAARFEEARLAPVVRAVPVVPDYRVPPPGSAASREGFRMLHSVVVDPGHGGRDPGNPGRFLPRGVKEKDITLAIGTRLRDELAKRGVTVVMTRSRDVFVNLYERAPRCGEGCDLFVSIHVNSLARTPGYQNVAGLETYFLDQARTAEAARVANMENAALRYETEEDLPETDPLAFILKDLHQNEYLRESALLADHIQRKGSVVHPGRNRGVQQAILAVLTTARRPAVLVETGFATNRRDAQFLASATSQQRLARAIADGIVAYLKRYEEKVLSGLSP